LLRHSVMKINFHDGWENYTPEIANILLMLQHSLGGIGYFRIEGASNSNKHIRYVISNREDLLKKVKPYFSLMPRSRLGPGSSLRRGEFSYRHTTRFATFSASAPSPPLCGWRAFREKAFYFNI